MICSCLIARNLLSGLKTCVEVANYMCDNGAATSQRSFTACSMPDGSERADADPKVWLNAFLQLCYQRKLVPRLSIFTSIDFLRIYFI